jgi:predicted N-formylglutamate amidohydrolase
MTLEHVAAHFRPRGAGQAMVDITEITSRTEWLARLEAAKLMNEALRARDFHWTVVSAIDGRLAQMEATAAAGADGHTPTLQERERCMTLGVIAVRSIYKADPEYCKLLLALANAFDGWTQLPYT